MKAPGPVPLALDDPRHGTFHAYCNLRCRCERCREANRVNHRRYVVGVQASGTLPGKHGTSNSYNLGCRCQLCRESNTSRSRHYRRRARQG